MDTPTTGRLAISEASNGHHRVVSREEWLAERKKLLAREKELTRLGDRIAQERRALPWVRIEKTYTFDTPAGRRTSHTAPVDVSLCGKQYASIPSTAWHGAGTSPGAVSTMSGASPAY